MKLPKTWHMKDGSKIKIKDMETSHLMYTIAMIENGIERHNNYLTGTIRDAYDAMKVQSLIIDPEQSPILKALWNELDTRELPVKEDKTKKVLYAIIDRLEKEIYRSEQRELHNCRYEEAFGDGLEKALDIVNKFT